MKHDLDPLSQFCRRCGVAARMLAASDDLADCTEENGRRAAARERTRAAAQAQALAKAEASRAIDVQPLPMGLTWGDLRRALGFDRWPS